MEAVIATVIIITMTIIETLAISKIPLQCHRVEYFIIVEVRHVQVAIVIEYPG